MNRRRLALSLSLSIATTQVHAANENVASCLLRGFRKIFSTKDQDVLRVELGQRARPSQKEWPEELRQKCKDADFYLLGQGGTSTIYRVVPAEGEPWVLKESKEVPREYLVHEMIRVYCERMGPCGFHVPPARYWGRRTFRGSAHHFMAMPDVRGRTLHSVLVDPQTPPEVSRQLRQTYLAALDQFDAVFHSWDPMRRMPDATAFPSQRRTYGDNIPMDGLMTTSFMALPENEISALYKMGVAPLPADVSVSKPLLSIIKSDNIIVDPKTLELTLIDPY